MPHVVCPRCQRANPADAVFCWFDGAVLRQTAVPAGASPFLPQEFIFPSGRRCRTYDDLLEGCQAEWEDARDMLHKGDFSRYLARLGRMDLVRAAQEAMAQGDPDLALQNFLSSLPASQIQGVGPRLDLSPRRLMLGAMRADEQRQVRISVSNKGKGVLQGKVRVSEGEQWLKIVPLTPTPLPQGARGEINAPLPQGARGENEAPRPLGERGRGEGGDERELPIKTVHDQEVVLRVEPRGLPAGQTYSGKLTVVTNGGVAEAPVRLDLTAAPFPKPPFQAASTARELAEQMRANPKPAGPLLESGDVARWFAANGWSYPVAGTPAKGVAAVQQFFECMGLSKPPLLELSQGEFHFQCEAPQTAHGEVRIRTPAKKWVYAQAAGDQPWLRVITPNVSGPQQTAISFEVDSSLMNAGPVQDGLLQITANAGQRFQVRVRVEVRRPRGYRAPAPIPRGADATPLAIPMPPAPVTLTPRQAALQAQPTMTGDPFQFEPPPLAPRRPHGSSGGRLVRMMIAGAVLALLLRGALLLPADLYARVIARGADSSPPTASWDFWRLGPMTDGIIDPGFLRQFIFAAWWVGAVAGLILVWRGGGRPTDVACGVVAGAASGVAGAATLACLTVLLDGLPRAVLGLLNAPTMSPWLATPLWLFLTLVCWTLLGGVAGLVLRMLGGRGRRILSAAAAPLTWVLRRCGAGDMASFFGLQ